MTSPNNSNWCCGSCGKDSSIPKDTNPPDDWVILEYYDSNDKKLEKIKFEILVCNSCKPNTGPKNISMSARVDYDYIS